MSGRPGADARAGAAPVVILACGNPSRGDDALGPLLLERLAGWLDEQGLAGGFELILDFQLQIEHALDLDGRALALFIDAALDQEAPVRLRPARPAAGQAPTSHALPPEAVLAVAGRLGVVLPPSYVLGVRGTEFSLGAGLSAPASAALDAAWQLLRDLCRDPGAAAWAARAESVRDAAPDGSEKA